MTTVLTQRRYVNPWLGTYFGIFASAFVALVLLLAIFEQLGAPDTALRWAMLLGPIACYVAIGVGARSSVALDHFAGGRRVPAVYAGLGLALAAIGGTGVMIGTGLFFINGFDAWCIGVGISAGFVAMGILVAPYIRKFGAFTVPGYFGQRFDSRVLRVISAAVVAVPMLLIIVAELKVAASACVALTGNSTTLMTSLLVLVLLASIAPGGLRSQTWSATAEAIVVLLSVLVPVGVVAAMVTNLPLPQLSHGPVLRAIGRLEGAQGVPLQIAPSLAFDLAGQGLESIGRRFAGPYTGVGPLAFILASFTTMAAIAAAPWLLQRCGSTPGIYETRKSIAWATLFGGLLLVTGSSIAVFMRQAVMDGLTDHRLGELPAWFMALQQMGLADVEDIAGRLPLGAFSFKRDTVIYALPFVWGFPAIAVYLTLAGVLAAALAAAGASITALGAIVTEDVLNGLMREPPATGVRIAMMRGALAGIAVITGGLAIALPSDPLWLFLWSLALSASAIFPVLVLSIWWKRVNAFGVVIGMLAGLAVAVLAIVGAEAGVFGLPSALAAVLGLPAGFVAGIAAAWARPAPDMHIMELVRDMRLPGGETLYDRHARLQRLKQWPPI